MDPHVDHVGGRSGGRTFTGRMIAWIVAAAVVIGMFLVILFAAVGGDGTTTRDVVEPQDTGTGSLPPEDTEEGGVDTVPGPRGGGGTR